MATRLWRFVLLAEMAVLAAQSLRDTLQGCAAVSAEAVEWLAEAAQAHAHRQTTTNLPLQFRAVFGNYPIVLGSLFQASGPGPPKLPPAGVESSEFAPDAAAQKKATPHLRLVRLSVAAIVLMATHLQSLPHCWHVRLSRCMSETVSILLQVAKKIFFYRYMASAGSFEASRWIGKQQAKKEEELKVQGWPLSQPVPHDT